MQASYDAICARIGIPAAELDQVNLRAAATTATITTSPDRGRGRAVPARPGTVRLPILKPTIARQSPQDHLGPPARHGRHRARCARRCSRSRKRLGRRERRQAEPLRGARQHPPHRLPLRRQLPRLARLARPPAVERMARRCSSRCWRRRRAPYGYARARIPARDAGAHGAGRGDQPHRDAIPRRKWPHKIHVPILTNDEVDLLRRRRRLSLPRRRGRRGQQHGPCTRSQNNGDTDRIHLIFEYYDLDQPATRDWASLDPPVTASIVRRVRTVYMSIRRHARAHARAWPGTRTSGARSCASCRLTRVGAR